MILYKRLLLMITAAGLIFGTTSCDDDDDDNSGSGSAGLVGEWTVDSWEESMYYNDELMHQETSGEEGDYMHFNEDNTINARIDGDEDSGTYQELPDGRLQITMEDEDGNPQDQMIFEYTVTSSSLTLDYEQEWEDGDGTYRIEVRVTGSR